MTPLDQQVQLFASAGAIKFPLPESYAWTEKIKRLHLLLMVKESAMDVPSTLKLEVFMEGYKQAELTSEEHSKVGRSLWAQCQAVADMKFTDVVSCQHYEIHKRSGDPRAQDILRLMTTLMKLKSKDRSRKQEKVYYSALVKAALAKAENPAQPVQNLDQLQSKTA